MDARRRGLDGKMLSEGMGSAACRESGLEQDVSVLRPAELRFEMREWVREERGMGACEALTGAEDGGSAYVGCHGCTLMCVSVFVIRGTPRPGGRWRHHRG
eukprot:2416402-Rhodomonas_salina.5